jgi:hypothetical protein
MGVNHCSFAHIYSAAMYIYSEKRLRGGAQVLLKLLTFIYVLILIDSVDKIAPKVTVAHRECAFLKKVWRENLSRYKLVCFSLCMHM